VVHSKGQLLLFTRLHLHGDLPALICLHVHPCYSLSWCIQKGMFLLFHTLHLHGDLPSMICLQLHPLPLIYWCRVAGSWCIHRRYHGGNVSFDINNWVYSADTLMHETLLQSEHR
jgi:hypothetical protein